MIRKKSIVLALLIVCILVAFDAFALTPVFSQILLLGLAMSAAGFVLMIMYYRQYPKPLRYFGLIILLLFIQSSVSTNVLYGQTFREGFLVNTPLLLTGIIYLAYYLCVRFKVTVEELTSLFLKLAWIGFLAMVYLYITDTSFAGGDDKSFGIQSLRKGIINLGAFLYLYRYFKEENLVYILYSFILFSSNHWVDFQRMIFFIFLLCIVLMLYHFRKKTPGIKLIMVLLLIIPMFSVFLSTSSVGHKISEKIGSAFEVFDSDRESYSEASVESRILQTECALASIRKYPVTGVGRIKNTNKQRITGLSYFYVSDIGLIGIVFSYGILGVIVLLSQYTYWFRNYFGRRFTGIDSIVGYKLYAIYLLMHTLVTGISVNSPVEFLLVVTVIELGKFWEAKKLEIEEA